MKESMALQSQRTYLPAAGRDSLLPLYDLMTKLMGLTPSQIDEVFRSLVLPTVHAVLG
jgi:hypothetical protein